ncbi:MAG TPA: hypothetical protein VHB99_17215 [Pirellulales bacterium]|nr:hypothetical protein [Pirellulales bacterium]
MKQVILAVVMATFTIGSAMAQSCESKAVDKNHKPLVGAAKTSFIKKCKQDTCEKQAVDKNNKPLVGAAKTSFMKKCESGA